MQRLALPFTIDSVDVSAKHVCSSVLTFENLRANNTSSCRVNPKERKTSLVFEKLREEEEADVLVFPATQKISLVLLLLLLHIKRGLCSSQIISNIHN